MGRAARPLSNPSAAPHVVLVDFWESTCIHCLDTLPALRSWHERYAARGLAIVRGFAEAMSMTAELRPRAGGGLVARVVIPRSAPEAGR